jgi:hypothetical protein
MPWFAAHVIMYFKRARGPQTSFTAWENVHLIEAADADNAWRQAERIGRASEGDDPTLREVEADGDHPMACVFAGVRKVITVSHERGGDQVGSGDEITFSEFILESEQAVRNLAAGKSTVVTYTDL